MTSKVDKVFESIAAEVLRAESKRPCWPDDLIHAAAIVSEESGELVKACLQHRYENKPIGNVRTEAIQTAAMCVRLLIDLAEGKGE